MGLCEQAIGALYSVPESQEVWLAEAWLVAATLALPLTPWLLERLGSGRTLALGTALFLAATVGTVLARTYGGLVLGVFLQGLATAPLLPLTQGMLAARLPESRRSLGMAVWNAGNVLGALFGSVAAEAALQRHDWTLAFMAPWPLALAGLALAWTGGTARTAAPPPFDFRGFALLSAAILALTTGLSGVGPSPWGLVAVGAAGVLAYGRHAAGHPQPLLDLRPLRTPLAGAAVLLSFAYNVLTAGQLETNYVVTQMSLSPEALALRGTLGPLASLAGVAVAGLAFDGLILVSLLVSLAGKTGICLYSPASSAFAAVWPTLVCNLGYWMVLTALSILLLRGLAPQDRPAGTALFALSTCLGNTLGLALLDGLFAFRSAAVGVDRAFHEMFWLEWVGLLPLLALVLRLRLRGIRYFRAPRASR